MENILLIGGCTGVGKSAFALELSKSLNIEIISADSIQVYKSLNRGTSKPTELEKKLCPHHLIDILDVNQNFNAYNFVELAKKKITEISRRGNLPVIVGGTGLYLECLLYGYSFDKTKSNEKTINYNYKLIVLNQDRAKLYERINQRVDIMIKNGLIEEVTDLYNRGITIDMQCMNAIGYKEIFMYLNGEITKEDAIELIKKRSRNYAKRQITWFKHMKEAEWVDVDCNLNLTLQNLVDFYSKYKK